VTKFIKSDVVVVGSSPILAMFALESRKLGKTVTLIERDSSLGGAWSTETVRIGDREIPHERACHLIEWYVGGYETLERISGTRFKVLDPQPVRVFNSGRVVPYTTRRGIILDYLKLLRSVAFAFLKICLLHLGIGKITKSDAADSMRRLLSKLTIDTLHRLLGIVKFDGVRGPKEGFPHFALQLHNRLKAEGVTILEGTANFLTKTSIDSINIKVGSKNIDCEQLIVGESISIENVSDNANFKKYTHCLISIPSSSIIIRNSYSYYPDHELFYRISYLEDTADENGQSIGLFLLQLRKIPAETETISIEFGNVQNAYRCVASVERLKILKFVEGHYLASAPSGGSELTANSNALVLKTVGDLSRNVLLLRNRLRRKT
jgi:hypothetical protein